jgi:hypothetical protein
MPAECGGRGVGIETISQAPFLIVLIAAAEFPTLSTARRNSSRNIKVLCPILHFVIFTLVGVTTVLQTLLGQIISHISSSPVVLKTISMTATVPVKRERP